MSDKQPAEIAVWEGHHPMPEGPKVMGCGWLMDHFHSVFTYANEIRNEVDSVWWLVFWLFALQGICDLLIVSMLWKLI